LSARTFAGLRLVRRKVDTPAINEAFWSRIALGRHSGGNCRQENPPSNHIYSFGNEKAAGVIAEPPAGPGLQDKLRMSKSDQICMRLK